MAVVSCPDHQQLSLHFYPWLLLEDVIRGVPGGHEVRSSQAVQFSRSVLSNSLQPHGLQHARLPCPSPNPGACSNLSTLSRGCHPTIPSSALPFSSRLQSFPASRSFQMSQFFASGGQRIGVSASASVLPVNISRQSEVFKCLVQPLINKVCYCVYKHHLSAPLPFPPCS